MLNLEGVKNVRFSKASIGGYKPEEVDEFIFKVEKAFESFEMERNENLKKIKKLKENSEKYLEEAGYIKDVLVNAKKTADQEIKEAKIKADYIINEAVEKSKNLVNVNDLKIKEQEQVLSNIKEEITNFKSRILNEYKSHLKTLGLIEKNIKFENKETEPTPEQKPAPEEEQSNVEEEKNNSFKKDISEKFQKLGGIKFGDKYKVKDDVESPINLFK